MTPQETTAKLQELQAIMNGSKQRYMNAAAKGDPIAEVYADDFKRDQQAYLDAVVASQRATADAPATREITLDDILRGEEKRISNGKSAGSAWGISMVLMVAITALALSKKRR